MSYVAVDKDGEELVYSTKPFKVEDRNFWVSLAEKTTPAMYVSLPKGSIKKLIGRDLTWNDEPVELE